MQTYIRRAMTLPEVLAIILILAIAIVLFLPGGHPREISRRTVCLANLRGIAQGCIVYAVGNNSRFPYCPPSAGDSPLGAAGFTRIGQAWNWDGVRGHPNDPDTGVAGNTRPLWLLVRMQAGDPKTFICPDDRDAGEPFIPQDLQGTYDVQNRSQLSYSFQYQGPGLTTEGRPRPGWNTTLKDDPNLVVLADRSPMLRAENPTTTDAAIGCQMEIARSDNFGKRFVQSLREGIKGIRRDNTVQARPVYEIASQTVLAALNSPNHKGEGQNVFRLDGSGDFISGPMCGAGSDNIWTVQDAAAYPQPQASTDDLRLFEARIRGVYDKSESDMLKAWQFSDRSRQAFPDSFLVP
jgi:hypothetical protein